MPSSFVSRSLLIIPLLVFIVFVLRSNDPSNASIIWKGFQNLLFQHESDYNSMLNRFCETVSTETFVQDEKTLSQNIVEKMRGVNPLVKMINELDSNQMDVRKNLNEVIEDYEETMTPVLILVGAALFLAFYCCIGTLCTGKKSSPTKRLGIKKKYIIGLNVILLIFLVFLGLSGLDLSERLQKSTNSAVCSCFNFLTHVEHGSPGHNWLGLRLQSSSELPLSRSAEKIEELRDISINPSILFRDSLTKIAESSFFSLQKLPRANPEITDLYFPEFLLNSVRARQLNPTDVQRALDEFETRDINVQKLVSKALDRLDTSLKKKQYLLEALDLAGEAIVINFVALLRFTYFSGVKVLSENSQLFLTLISLFLCAISSISLLFLCLPPKHKIRIVGFLKMSWWLLSGLLMFGWIVSLVVLPTNVQFVEVCGVLKKSIEDPIFFNRTMNRLVDIPRRPHQYPYTCFHGDADIFSTFMKDSTELDKDNGLDALDIILEDLPETPKEFPQLGSLFEDYRSGILSDSHETNADLEKLNSLTMIKTSCDVIKDTWVLNSANCTESMGENFLSRNPSYWNMGKPTCIGLNQWMGFAGKSKAERYAPKDCMDKESRRKMRRAQEFVEEFVQNRKELEKLLLEMHSDLNEAAWKYRDYVKKLKKLSKISHEIENDLKVFHSKLFAPESGLMLNMKCDVIKKDLQEFEKGFCRNFVPTVFEIFSMITVVLVISIVTAWRFFIFEEEKAKQNEDKDEDEERNMN